MEFVVKKTTELTNAEKVQINVLFNEVFEKERTIKEFDNQFLNNPLGYAYHAMMIENGEIVGHNSGIPCYYMVNGERNLFVCNVDTMIKKHHRGIENFYDLMNAAYSKYREDGIAMVYGFPNDNSYPLLTKLSFMKDIDKLDTYCLPYRIGGVKRNLIFLNFASQIFSLLWVKVATMFASSTLAHFTAEKEAESYNKTRYLRGDADYSIIKKDGFEFVYKIITYENVRTAFIIDVMGKSAVRFCKAVSYLLKNEKANFDLILYVGHLPFKHYGLIKFPRKYEPKHFNFTGYSLADNAKDKNVLFDIANWDVNLSNYDLI